MDIFNDLAMAARSGTEVVDEGEDVVEGAVGGVGEGFVAAGSIV